MKEYFDIEALKQVPIDEVLERFGARYVRGHKSYSKTFAMHCFCGMHEHGDKNPSLIVWRDKNICKCMVNPEIKGDTITLVKNVLFNGDFKQACIWLHEQFGIPYIENYDDDKYSDFEVFKKKAREVGNKSYVKKEFKREKKEIVCLDKQLQKKYIDVDINKYINMQDKMNKKQRLKLIYSFIYRFSLQTKQDKKYEYYESRGIKNQKNLKNIGYLSKEDITGLMEELFSYFDLKDLEEFKIINSADHPKRPFDFKYISGDGFCVVPNGMELSNSLINGLILRPTKLLEFQKAKEFQISCPDIVLPIPFGLNRDSLKGNKFYITEGHIDALSIKEVLNDANIIAVPGVHNISEEWLCLLKNKEIIIAFDNDKAGEEGAEMLKQVLQKYTDKIKVLKWDKYYGKDINEVLNNKKLKFVI